MSDYTNIQRSSTTITDPWYYSTPFVYTYPTITDTVVQLIKLTNPWWPWNHVKKELNKNIRIL